MNLTFRKFNKEDIIEAAIMMQEAFKSEPWNESWSIKQCKDRYIEIFNSYNFFGYIALSDNEIVSVLVGHIYTYLDSKQLIIDDFSVCRKYQHMGIGSQMFKYCENIAKENNINEIILETYKDSCDETFYSKLGMKRGQNLIVMEKKI